MSDQALALMKVVISLVVVGLIISFTVYLVNTIRSGYHERSVEFDKRAAITRQVVRDAGWTIKKIDKHVLETPGTIYGKVEFGACELSIEAPYDNPRAVQLIIFIPLVNESWDEVTFELKDIQPNVLRDQRANFGLGHCFIDQPAR